MTDDTNNKNNQYTFADMVDAVRLYDDETDGPISSNEYEQWRRSRDEGLPSLDTIYRRTSWNAVREATDAEPKSDGRALKWDAESCAKIDITIVFYSIISPFLFGRITQRIQRTHWRYCSYTRPHECGHCVMCPLRTYCHGTVSSGIVRSR